MAEEEAGTVIRSLTFALFLALPESARATAAAPSPLWGRLVAGPYVVGFQHLERSDPSRPYRPVRGLDGTPRTGERARPMHISIWYPAKSTPADAKPLTFGDYVAMVGAESRFGSPTDAERAEGERTFFQFPIFRDMSVPQRERLKLLPGLAYRDAAPAPGKFPLILYSLGSAALAHVTPEYLASHGYVVAQMPRLGVYSGLPPEGIDARDFESKIRDIDFVINVLHGSPSADLSNMGVVGFSAGGRWALSEVMRPGDVRAVVSLDSVMLFNDAAGQAWRKLPLFDLDAVRVPILHLIRREWVAQEDRSMWEQMRYAERTSLVFEDASLDHLDFQSAGYATTLVGMRPKAAAVVAATFEAFNRYTLAFFDAYLKENAEAKQFLARRPEQNGVPAELVTAKLTPALPAPITELEFLNEVQEGGMASAIAAFRRGWKERGEPPVPEQALNLAGYRLLFGGHASDALQLFELNIEAHPESANAYDSAADGYLATGDREKALERARKASSLLDADRSLSPERRERIRRSIEEKLASPARKSS